jgi:hypothetical protein
MGDGPSESVTAESCGGMSDLSLPMHDSSKDNPLVGGGTATAVALAATICTSLANGLLAAAGLVDGGQLVNLDPVLDPP